MPQKQPKADVNIEKTVTSYKFIFFAKKAVYLQLRLLLSPTLSHVIFSEMVHNVNSLVCPLVYTNNVALRQQENNITTFPTSCCRSILISGVHKDGIGVAEANDSLLTRKTIHFCSCYGVVLYYLYKDCFEYNFLTKTIGKM